MIDLATSSTLNNALEQLKEIGGQSKLVTILDHEDIKKTIADIFGRIDDARVEFEVCSIP